MQHRISVLALAAALALAPFDALAQGRGTGRISGRVSDEATGNPLAGVTITVTGPALQGEATEFTGEDGSYLLTDLPPGEYLVRFYYADLVIERPNVKLSADQTLAVNVSVPAEKAKTETIQITERAPTVDVGNTQVQTTVTREFVRRTPNRNRSYESVLLIAPGSAIDDVGVSFNGSTGPENAFLINGLNTTNPSHGLLSSRLTLEFIEETEIISGGYQAEYGRSTGGVVNVVTRSGSNDLKGELFFGITPLQLQGETRARLGEAVASRSHLLNNELDIGFTVSGPIVKDHVWFFAGFHPQYSEQSYDRFLRRRLANDIGPDDMTYEGDLVGGRPMTDEATRAARLAGCAEWTKNRSPELCPDPAFVTEDIPGTDRSFHSQAWLLNYIAKFDFRLDDDNRISLEYIGAPSRFNGVRDNLLNGNPNFEGRGFNADPATYEFGEDQQVHDVIGHYVSKWFERKLTMDIFLGYHLETDVVDPEGTGPLTRDTNVRSLSIFEDVAACAPRMISGVFFDPCPVSNYDYGGFGLFEDTSQSRLTGSLYLTYLAQLGGAHELKLGGDFELNRYRDKRSYTGLGLHTILDAFGTVEQQAFGRYSDPETLDSVVIVESFEADVTSAREMVFLRDSYRPEFLPGLTLNAGLRWELEQLKDAEGETLISLSDNIAPRIGVVYDWTQKGLSKIYASYGQFYEAIPLNLSQRQFAGEVIVLRYTDQCSRDARGRLIASTCDFAPPTPDDAFGGSTKISPVLKGQYLNEIVAGLEYDVGDELVLGAAYIHRDLGRVIEDISVDGAHTYFIANPGEENPGAIKDLQDDIARLETDLAAANEADRADIETMIDEKKSQIVLLRGAATFPRPTRDYNALMLTARKRFSNRIALLASYTYSRTIGNYPGLYQASNQQIDPNLSTQLDLTSLLLNREGPLPNDRPHNIKIIGSYYYPIGDESQGEGLTFALAFNGQSGVPIEVLGRDPLYGEVEAFILPRGSGGRTPFLTSVDLKIGYLVDRLEFSWEIFNVLNQRSATGVDEEYTPDSVQPIVNGTPADLPNLKTTSGLPVRKNPNYGQPTSFQQPLAMRFGARVKF
jgi:hypothetical protein